MVMPPKRLPLEAKGRKQARKRSTGGGGGGGSAPGLDGKGKAGARGSGAPAGAEPVHEAFVRAFGVPTNMYRYLARRHLQRPLLLHRSLSYMRRRRPGRPPRRSVEQIAAALAERAKTGSVAMASASPGAQMCCDLPFNASLTLTFIGIFDSAKEKEWETVEAELDVLVVHYCFDRRKQRASRVVRTLATGRPLACNPPSGAILSGAGGSSASSGAGAQSKSVTLLYKELVENTRLSRTEHSQLVLRLRAKERRLYLKVYDSPPSASKRSRRDDRFEVRYRAGLPLLHQRGHLELLDGEYEARLEVDPDPEPDEAPGQAGAGPGGDVEQLHEREAAARRSSEWLSLAVPQTAPEMVEFESWPCVRFVAQWQGSRQACQRLRAATDRPVRDDDEDEDEKEARRDGPGPEPMEESEEKKDDSSAASTAPGGSGGGPALTVTYRFVHDGQLRQWSETRDFVCPWCERDCRQARSLVAHLAACHPRFAFRSHHAPARNHLSLEVTLSRDFDASNDSIGFRRQAAHRAATPGAGINCPPARRLPFTHLVHWKGLMHQAQPTSASGRPLRVGHQRQYYHTWSCLPVHPSEFEMDSEEEESTAWLYQFYQRNIAEFTDVNAGEKRLMTLWNAHLLRHKFLGDGQVGMAAEAFVCEQGAVLAAEGLRGNLVLHLANLADYGVLRPEAIERCVALFDQQQQRAAPGDGAGTGHDHSPPPPPQPQPAAGPSPLNGAAPLAAD